MMIRMQITPAHPFRLRQRAEDWMLLPAKIFLLGRKARQQRFKLLHVARELDGSRPADLLIRFGARLVTFRPRERRLKRDPLEYRPLERITDRLGGAHAHRHPERIAQMTDHLMRRHAPPKPSAVWSELSQPRDNFVSLLLLAQTLQLQTLNSSSGLVRASRPAADILHKRCRECSPSRALRFESR